MSRRQCRRKLKKIGPIVSFAALRFTSVKAGAVQPARTDALSKALLPRGLALWPAACFMGPVMTEGEVHVEVGQRKEANTADGQDGGGRQEVKRGWFGVLAVRVFAESPAAGEASDGSHVQTVASTLVGKLELNEVCGTGFQMTRHEGLVLFSFESFKVHKSVSDPLMFLYLLVQLHLLTCSLQLTCVG